MWDFCSSVSSGRTSTATGFSDFVVSIKVFHRACRLKILSEIAHETLKFNSHSVSVVLLELDNETERKRRYTNEENVIFTTDDLSYEPVEITSNRLDKGGNFSLQ